MAFLTEAANRGSVSTGYEIDNSLKLESDNSEYLDNRHHTAGNQKTWTLSFWIKRTELGTTQKPYDAGNAASIGFLSSDKIQIENSNLYLVTNRVFQDTSAWYHIVQLNDSTQSTASNRAKLWINGVQETVFSSETYMAQNENGNMNSATSISIGGGGGAHVNGYMAELFFVDGQALAPTDFGEFDDSGIWIPKEYDGTLSGTSIKLDFSNSSALWEDSSGLSGNGTAMSGVNITAADQATDTPTNNFAVLNYNHVYSPAAMPTISHGAKRLTTTYQGWWTTAISTFAFDKGKWYYEARPGTSTTHLASIGYGDEGDIENWGVDRSANRQCHVGRTHSGVASKSYGYIGSDTEGASYGRIFPNGTSPSTRVNYLSSDVIGVAIDADNGYAYWHKNGTYINSGDPTSGSSGTGGYAVPTGTGTTGLYYLAVSAYYHSSIGVIEVNFGGHTESSISSGASDASGYGVFEYAPPAGYYALCTKNLAKYG